MTETIFFSQKYLEDLLDAGKVTLNDGQLVQIDGKKSWRVEPAVRIVKILDGEDSSKLMGVAISVSDLTKQGGEHCQTSVILNNCAYECEEGFLGTPQNISPLPETVSNPLQSNSNQTKPQAPQQPPPSQPSSTANQKSPQDDTDLLADFMLKHL